MLIVHHVILIKNIIQLQGAIFERIRNIQIGARISSKTTLSNMTFRRIRHLVEKALIFFQSATLSNYFFMYNILSKLIFVVPNGLIFTI